MKNDPLPADAHVSRYFGAATKGKNGRPTAMSFLPRYENEEYLSVNWLEHLRLGDRFEEVAEIRSVLATKLTLGKSAGIAVLNVGEIQRNLRNNSPDRRRIRILHRPDEPDNKPDPSHSGIFDITRADRLHAQLISEKVLEVYQAVNN